MKKLKSILIIVIVEIFYLFQLQAQNCNCKEEFLYMKGYIEKNYAGYRDKLKGKESEYNAITEQVLNKIEKDTQTVNCFIYLGEWLSYFQDGHTGIKPNYKNYNKNRISEFKFKNQVINTSEIENIDKHNGIEGIYSFKQDTSLKVIITKNKSDEIGDYLIRMLTPFPKQKVNRGDIFGKIIESNDKKHLSLIMVGPIPAYVAKWNLEEMFIKNDAININGYISRKFEIKNLNEKILYFRIPTFFNSGEEINNLIDNNKDLIDKTPYWVIDLRGNNGGQDGSYQPITPYLYTNPIKVKGLELLASEDNIKFYSDLMTDTTLSDGDISSISKQVENMKINIGKFIPNAENENLEYKMDSIKKYPTNVVILMDKSCISSAEQFILEMKQSEKVTLMGENTKGVLDYSNTGKFCLKCLPYCVSYSTTRSKRIDFNQGIDNIGIAPDIKLSEDKNWIEEATKYLENVKK